MPYVEIINGDQVPPDLFSDRVRSSSDRLELLRRDRRRYVTPVAKARTRLQSNSEPVAMHPGGRLQSNSADGGAVCFEPSAINRSYGIG